MISHCVRNHSAAKTPTLQKFAAEDTTLSTINAAGETVTVPVKAETRITIHVVGLHYNRAVCFHSQSKAAKNCLLQPVTGMIHTLSGRVDSSETGLGMLSYHLVGAQGPVWADGEYNLTIRTVSSVKLIHNILCSGSSK